MVTPQGVRANSWEDVADLSATLGITLDAWQELILEAAMGERTDHTWAAKRVGISVPRQNGKSQLLVARALAGALLFGEKKIVISAHQQDTARESFSKLMEIIEEDANDSLRKRLDPRFGRGGIMNAINREAVRFNNGSTIQFKARSGAAGKGFSSDCLLLDEAQILGSRAWTSINSTMSAMRNPQVWLLGTPPQEEDDSYAFEMVRSAAIGGKSTASAWCEWGADPSDPDYDPASEHTRWSANPAWNTRINHEVVQGEFETYTPERFAQDRLGLWFDGLRRDAVFGMGKWEDCAEPGRLPEQVLAIGLAVAYGREQASVGAFDGATVGLVAREPGAGWLVPEAKRLQERYRCAVVIAGTGPASDLIPALEAAGVDLTIAKGGDSADACAGIFDAVREKRLAHPDQPELNQAVEGAHTRLRDDRWVWDRRNSAADVSPLEAVTLALWGAGQRVTYDPLDSIY